jgi:signal transduction histidine kinase
VANSIGVWNENSLEWHIQVATPWWETTLFRLLVLAALVGAMYYVFRFRLQQQLIVLENQQLLLEKEITLRNERDRIAAEMHDDLGAGLSTIRFLSLLAKEKETDAVKAGRIDKIARSAAEVMEKMSDIIWVMNSRNDSLENFAGYFRRYAGEYLDTHGILLIFELPENLPPLLLSGEQRRALLLVLKECLHNVVKHAGASELHLQVSLNGCLEITLQDNGKGLPPTAENHGNGLSNIHRRVEALGGTARFENDNGVKVTLKTGIITE